LKNPPYFCQNNNTMGRPFKKPWASYRSQNGTDECRVFDTYAALRGAMKAMMSDSVDNVVEVTRTRRGEWGQWFERWAINEATNKLEKIKETWL
jgi:hypothetical protein